MLHRELFFFVEDYVWGDGGINDWYEYGSGEGCMKKGIQVFVYCPIFIIYGCVLFLLERRNRFLEATVVQLDSIAHAY